MKLVIAKCIVTENRRGEWTDKSSGQKRMEDNLKIEEGNSSIILKGGELLAGAGIDLSQVPVIEPVMIEAEVKGRVYNGALSLVCIKPPTIKRLTPAA